MPSQMTQLSLNSKLRKCVNYMDKLLSYINRGFISLVRVGSLFWCGDCLNELVLHHFTIYAIAFWLSSTTLTERWLNHFNGSSRVTQYRAEVVSYFCRDALVPSPCAE